MGKAEPQTVDEFLDSMEKNVEQIGGMVAMIKKRISSVLGDKVYKSMIALTDEEKAIRADLLARFQRQETGVAVISIPSINGRPDVAVTVSGTFLRRIVLNGVQLYPLIDEQLQPTWWMQDCVSAGWNSNLERGLPPLIHCPKCDAILDKDDDGEGWVACDSCGHEFHRSEGKL